MKNILIILTGGTICSALNENGNLSVFKNAGIKIIENFNNSNSIYKDKVKFSLTKNLHILSENMTVDKLNEIISLYKKHTKNKKYDGIIFLHGTDTLSYSASLFSMLLCGTKTPVFFVSSHKPLAYKESNGNENFKCAVECIVRGILPNVYVTYKNPSDNKMYLHLGSRITQCENYSDDFESAGKIDISNLNEENYKDYFSYIEKAFKREEIKEPFDIYKPFKLKNSVLKIEPYVGIDYSAYKYKRFLAVLHGAFHSGTVCTEDFTKSSVLYMLKKCEKNGYPDIYFSPLIIKKGGYESAARLLMKTKKDPSFLYGLTSETAYIKLLIAYSLFKDKEKIKEFINNEYNLEFIKRSDENDEKAL